MQRESGSPQERAEFEAELRAIKDGAIRRFKRAAIAAKKTCLLAEAYLEPSESMSTEKKVECSRLIQHALDLYDQLPLKTKAVSGQFSIFRPYSKRSAMKDSEESDTVTKT